mgnify:FL=1|jgi:hypothetical protein
MKTLLAKLLGLNTGGDSALGSFAKDLREAIKGKEIDPAKALELIKVQNEVNKIEAQHRSIFVAGWRPFIGWVCGVALLYNFILRDIIAWLSPDIMPPALQMDHLITILLGMLGLGGLRTYEKLKDKTK